MSKSLLTVLNFGPHDHALAIAALQASVRLCGQFKATLALAFSQGVLADSIRKEAEKAFTDVRQIKYDEWTGDHAWPVPQNHAWQQVARHLCAANTLSPDYAGWFWWEPDAVPLRSNWYEALDTAYRKGVKKFAGFKLSVAGIDYMNGVGIYPMDAPLHLQDCGALYSMVNPFDLSAGHCVMRSFLPLNGIMLHARKKQGGGVGQAFTAHDYSELLRANKEAVFYHGCTDGTLHALVGVEKLKQVEKLSA